MKGCIISMNENTVYDRPYKRRFPHIGRRIVKTSIAVFICLLIAYLWGYRGSEMPTESCITAIICMQPYVRDSREFAVNRFIGTMIGAVWGLLFLLLLLMVPEMGRILPLVYARMAVGVLLSLYTAVLIGKQDAAGLAAIVFLCVVISFPEIEEPLKQSLQRVLNVFIGTGVAIIVNVFRFPREKRRNQVFFVRTKALAPDRFSHIEPAAMFRLNYLYQDGARICLMSEHAPAFFILQMSSTMLNTPLIVMDGAAIYDFNTNRFLQTETIPTEESERIRERLNGLGLSYFIYTVHNNKTSIFHEGALTPEEKRVLARMRRSPYRDYLEGEILNPEEIVYFKVIDLDEKLAATESHLYSVMPRGKVRAVRRKQAGAEGISGLYIYAHTATMEQAEKRLMNMLQEENPELVPVEIRLRTDEYSDSEAMHVISRVANLYEPIRLFRHRKVKS